ncbi:Hypothetical predicted protein [Olea europaea subsp. europaea]|uniref:FAR1 domain-containing protein n=1 Tax=Olea europaea subsp. europaea TaxID=158383 RepID=A0A8S0TW47_OLEEU|nr:Hypothetical predicted protein [Olea europaea subsp. europaea]
MISTKKETLEEDGPTVLEVPEVGMMLKDEKELWDFYKRYAYHIGFPIRRRNSKKGDDGKMKYMTLTCGREGRRPTSTSGSSKPQPTTQIDCKARVIVSVDVYGIWRINTVHLDHNHKTSPSKSRLYCCN